MFYTFTNDIIIFTYNNIFIYGQRSHAPEFSSWEANKGKINLFEEQALTLCYTTYNCCIKKTNLIIFGRNQFRVTHWRINEFYYSYPFFRLPKMAGNLLTLTRFFRTHKPATISAQTILTRTRDTLTIGLTATELGVLVK